MYIQYVLVVSIIPKCILHPKFKQITHIYVYIYITYIYPTYIYMYICIINMRVNVEGLSTGNNKKILWTSTLFFKTGGFSSPRDRPRREVPWAWWCQTLVSSKSSPPTKPNPRGDDPRKVWLPRPLSQVETWWMNFSQMWMSNIASKHWEVFFWSKDGVFPKTPECDVLNRTGIAGWGLWIPRFYEWFPSKKVPTDGWKPAITT